MPNVFNVGSHFPEANACLVTPAFERAANALLFSSGFREQTLTQIRKPSIIAVDHTFPPVLLKCTVNMCISSFVGS